VCTSKYDYLSQVAKTEARKFNMSYRHIYDFLSANKPDFKKHRIYPYEMALKYTTESPTAASVLELFSVDRNRLSTRINNPCRNAASLI
jgi:hypothetical protein